MNVQRVRVARTSTLEQVDLSVLREFAEYQADRKVIGTTLLQVKLTRRGVQLCTLENGEHLLLLMQDHRFVHWEPSRAPFEQLHQRACDWLTEPGFSDGV